jgi:rhamnogalacturonyl hydrolase YesR
VLIYPISAESDVVVEIRNEEILEALDIQFYNLLGQTMTEPKQLLTNETRFDTQTWADGFYVAVLKRISDGKVIRKQKLFVD